jgi:hypothetical protein
MLLSFKIFLLFIYIDKNKYLLVEHIKLFENAYVEPFEDYHLKIQVIKYGPNAGKILFKVKNSYPQIKYSMLFGVANILDTKYESMSKIRNIELFGKFKKVQISTVQAILSNFLTKMGYDKEEAYDIKFFRVPILIDKLQNLINTSKTLGEIIDGLRDIREEFFENEKQNYEKWKIRNDVKKYNL